MVPIVLFLSQLVWLSEVKFLKLIVIEHHASASHRRLLTQGMTEIHHVRPQLFPLGIIPDLIQLQLCLVPEIDVPLCLFPELLKLILKLLLLALHLKFKLIEFLIKVLLYLVDQAVTYYEGGLLYVCQTGVDAYVHV